MKHLKMSIAASIAALGMAIATPALADPPRHAQAHGYYKKANKQAVSQMTIISVTLVVRIKSTLN